MKTETALVKTEESHNPGTMMRWATDVAGVSRDIVMRTAVEIQGRKYVKVEGWQAIAVAHGCAASARDVEEVKGGFRAIGEVKRMSDGVVISSAEGFIGADEAVWFGGEAEVWNKQTRQKEKKILPKRAEYAIRAMCQTRAISRACRSAFAHVVVLIDGNLSTTPLEEVPEGGFVDAEVVQTPPVHQNAPQRQPEAKKEPSRVSPINGATIIECQFESFKESTGTSARGPWTAWFCKFNDNGQTLEAGTFDKKIGEKLDTLQGQLVRLEYKASKKAGKLEIISLEPADSIPMDFKPQDESQASPEVPF